MSELIDTTQMYLRTIVELEEEGVTPRRARIAERLEQSSPTVSQTAARMERDGLLTLSEDRIIELTPEGRAEGIRVMRRHRLAECLLVDKLGLSLEEVHDEACRWEHVLSDMVEERIAHFLDEPTISPFGNPIPGLDQLGLPPTKEAFLDGAWSIEDALAAGIDNGVVVRISENMQRERDVIGDVVAAGIVPGARVSFSDDGHTGTITGPQGSVDLPSSIAASLFVRRDA